MEEKKISCLFVINDKNNPVGIITLHDI
ncbi:MAG TPA: CBS domain-containing protein [Mailhella massiliensis]|uniref:CBS domain-containing protein n=1 Tax=Mailhella massiliensis TaxID=1903261 RepID=A0A921AUK1_9BACT|nr:CBS domain-containing protein [Mailhella massiliensis]